jgi:hypothetical protein
MNELLMLLAVTLLTAAMGFRFGYWLAIRRYEPKIEGLLEKNGDLRSELRQEKGRMEITKMELSSKVKKLKSKIKKRKKK